MGPRCPPDMYGGFRESRVEFPKAESLFFGVECGKFRERKTHEPSLLPNGRERVAIYSPTLSDPIWSGLHLGVLGGDWCVVRLGG